MPSGGPETCPAELVTQIPGYTQADPLPWGGVFVKALGTATGLNSPPHSFH
jgi:hypothetical protein